MSMVDDIGGEEGLHRASELFFEHVKVDEKLQAIFEGVDTPDRREKLEGALRLFLEFEPDQAAALMQQAHQGLAGKGLTDDAFDAIYDHYHETLAEVGVPGGMLYGFLEGFEDLRGELVAH